MYFLFSALRVKGSWLSYPSKPLQLPLDEAPPPPAFGLAGHIPRGAQPAGLMGSMLLATLLVICALQTWTVLAMRADYLAQLRQETVDMFYHGYSNYMQHAFPEDEVRHPQADKFI